MLKLQQGTPCMSANAWNVQDLNLSMDSKSMKDVHGET